MADGEPQLFKPRGGQQFRKKRVEREESSEEADPEPGALDDTKAKIDSVRESQKERFAPQAVKKALLKKKLKEELLGPDEELLSEDALKQLRYMEAFDPLKW